MDQVVKGFQPALEARVAAALALPSTQDGLLAAGDAGAADSDQPAGGVVEHALDLLAVDSLITYAFQAAADEPALMDARTARALARIAALPGSLGA